MEFAKFYPLSAYSTFPLSVSSGFRLDPSRRSIRASIENNGEFRFFDTVLTCDELVDEVPVDILTFCSSGSSDLVLFWSWDVLASITVGGVEDV